MQRLILAVATGLYSGMLPKAPGTWGSLAAFIPWIFLQTLPLPTYLAVTGVVFIIGFLAAGSAEKILDKADAGPIVIDEIVGMFITLTLCPLQPLALLLAFVFFRFFDILKPFPVSWFDRHLHGGLGIMLDDVMAGIYACICLHLCLFLFSLFS